MFVYVVLTQEYYIVTPSINRSTRTCIQMGSMMLVY